MVEKKSKISLKGLNNWKVDDSNFNRALGSINVTKRFTLQEENDFCREYIGVDFFAQYRGSLIKLN